MSLDGSAGLFSIESTWRTGNAMYCSTTVPTCKTLWSAAESDAAYLAHLGARYVA